MLKRVFAFLFILVSVFALSTSPLKAQQANQQDELLEARVERIVSEEKTTIEDQPHTRQKLALVVTKGSIKGQTILVDNGAVLTASSPVYKVGDKVVVVKSIDIEGKDAFYISDYVRRQELLILFIVFAVLAIGIGGIWGLSSLFGMAFSFLVIFKFILPQILKGVDPVTTAILGAAMIIPVTFYLSHGFKMKTHIAIIGTLITLMATGLLATIFVETTKLSGFASEEAGFLQSQLGNLVNMKGLLLAGIIIASLGILDDITISQASIVRELKDANKNLKFKDLFFRAMKVGRDHIASLVNTLVLVYAGASLPLLLLFINNPQPFSQVINLEIIADEIVRTLVGSIGLILAVPITTLLSSLFIQNTATKEM